MKNYNYLAITFILIFFTTISFAQDKEAKITLTFEKADSLNICKALVISGGVPVKDVNVKLSVKRLFSNLKLGSDVATDENGVATFEVPQDIPSRDKKLTIFANISDDEIYKNAEASSEIDWGVEVAKDNFSTEERSIAAGRDGAPIYFIVSSLLVIGLVWGFLIYAVLQVFKIKRLGSSN